MRNKYYSPIGSFPMEWILHKLGSISRDIRHETLEISNKPSLCASATTGLTDGGVSYLKSL